jgi:glycosyltransferase involved in cell wall biosynthesis
MPPDADAATKPAVSVVIATRDRPVRLAQALAALRAQDAPPGTFEVIVVDDASGPETERVLREADLGPGLELRVLHKERAGGPGAARNDGWRIARGDLIAFTDDDCVAGPGWVRAGLAAAGPARDRIVQGAVEPRADELHRAGLFSHTLVVEGLGYFQTANIFYPRALLGRLGGFDPAAFPRNVLEDTDLGWRALEAGAEVVWAPEALAFHAVDHVGPRGRLRIANRWDGVGLMLSRHPEFRRHVYRRFFWRWSHYALARVLIALVLPRRRRILRRWLAHPYVIYLLHENDGSLRPARAPFLALYDLVEMASIVRSGIRFRKPIV